ncbi:hypothetical protein [Caminibacter pacificus]|jgi:hypothetical protein
MKYILPIILLILLTGCNKKESNQKNNENNQSKIIRTESIITKNNEKPKENPIVVIKLKDLNLTFNNGKLVYPNKKTVILFDDGTPYCTEQKDVLKRLKVKYITTDNKYLENYFNIKLYPTIVILDKNKTIKYENFTPYEFLKEAF